MITLDRLVPGRRARIVSLGGEPALVQRLAELGLIEGDDIEVLAVAPFGDPIEFRCGGGRLSLRKAEAARVFIAEHS